MTDAEGSLRPGELKRGRCAGTEVCCAAVHTLHGRTAESCAPLYSTQSSHTAPPPEITTDKSSGTTLLLYFTQPSHTAPPPEITTNKSSGHHSTALLHTAISAPPLITTDKSSGHHSTALLHTATSDGASSYHNRQVIRAPLYYSTSHCHLTQRLLRSQQTSVQRMCILCSTAHHIMHTLHSMQHQWVHPHEQARMHTHTHDHDETTDHASFMGVLPQHQ